jgi:hypothetical protein
MSEPLPLARLTLIPLHARRQLRRRGLTFTTDLLRCATLAVQSALGKPTTVDDIRRWQAVASLLEIDGMTLKWALALQQRGIVAARDVGRRRFSALAALFAAAKRQGEISAMPDADTIVALMLDATAIRLGAVLNATVTGTDKKPLANAQLTCNGLTATTDTHGRARLLRLPLGVSLDLTIDKSGFLPLTAKIANLKGTQVIEGHHFALKRARSRKARSAKALSEFKGDILTIHAGQRIHLREVKNKALRVGDVLRYIERLQRGGDVKLVSYFKETEDGQPIAPIWRVPAATLPANLGLGDSVKVTRQGLKKVSYDARQIARQRIARQVVAELNRQYGKPRTRAQRDRRIRKGMTLFVQRTRSLRGATH